MNDRYTSPALSRDLAAAGLSQAMSRAWWSMHLGDPFLSERAPYPVPTFNNYDVRALDLTDILRELTRPRPEEADTRPLCDGWYMSKFTREQGYRLEVFVWGEESLERDAVSAVEAAAACLTTLLRERKKDAQPEWTTDGNGFHEVGPRW